MSLPYADESDQRIDGVSLCISASADVVLGCGVGLPPRDGTKSDGVHVTSVGVG